MFSDGDAAIEVSGELRLSHGSVLKLNSYSEADRGKSNLQCVDENGGLRWSAPLRDPNLGHYVAIRIRNGRLFANTFDCFLTEISLEDGSILSEEFTK